MSSSSVGRSGLGWTMGWLFALGALSACADPSATHSDQGNAEQGQVGTLRIPLVAHSNGQTYRLSQATFVISGSASATLSTDGLADDAAVGTSLPVGMYTVTLSAGWKLEQQTANGWVVVDATLEASAIGFGITANATAQITFHFQAHGTPVTMDQGAVDIGFDVSDGGVCDASTSGDGGTVLAKAVQIAVNDTHSCTVWDDGRVECWGQNEAGELGLGDTLDRPDSHQTTDINLGGAAKEVVVGTHHSCALLTTGDVVCWGLGTNGRLGYGNTDNIGDDESPSAAGTVQVGGAVAHLAAGDAHTCAVLTTGALRCWGSGFFGQLGYGNTHDIGDDETPASAGDVPFGAAVAQVGAQNERSCAPSTAGVVKCFGFDADHTLQFGDDEPASAAPSVFDSPVAQLSVGGAPHECGVLTDGVSITCRGETKGEPFTFYIGDGNLGAPVTQIVSGGDFNCARLAGTVKCWGNGASLQLPGSPGVPIAQAYTVSAMPPTVSISTEGGTACGVHDDGSVYCW